MNQKSKLSYVAFFIVLIIVCIASYFIGNFTPVLNTSNGSFPDYEGFDEISYNGIIEGEVSNITITDAVAGTGSITIKQGEYSATFPLNLYINQAQGITGVEGSGERVDINNVKVGNAVALTIIRETDKSSSNYNTMSVFYITIKS